MSDFEFRVGDVFLVPGRGLVVAGAVLRGAIHTGDRVAIEAPSTGTARRVDGIEVGREIVRSATGGQNVALLFTGLTPEELGDGVERLESGGWALRDLIVQPAPAPWWAFWRWL